MASSRLQGVIAAIPTPIDAAGEPDTDRFCRPCAMAAFQRLRRAQRARHDGRGELVFGRPAAHGDEGGGLGARLEPADGRHGHARHRHDDRAQPASPTPRLRRSAGVAALLLQGRFGRRALRLVRKAHRRHARCADRHLSLQLPADDRHRILAGAGAAAGGSIPPSHHRRQGQSGDLAYAAELAKIEGFDVFPSSETALARTEIDGFAGCISATVSVTAPLVGQPMDGAAERRRCWKVAVTRAGDRRAVPLIPAVKYLVGRLHGDPAFGSACCRRICP